MHPEVGDARKGHLAVGGAEGCMPLCGSGGVPLEIPMSAPRIGAHGSPWL